MLVLSRKVGERVVIDNEIIVQVLEVNGQRIRLGVEAPPEIGIWREEIAGDEHLVSASAPAPVVRKPR